MDENWTKTDMAPLRGRSPRGGRMLTRVPNGKWNTITLYRGAPLRRAHDLGRVDRAGRGEVLELVGLGIDPQAHSSLSGTLPAMIALSSDSSADSTLPRGPAPPSGATLSATDRARSCAKPSNHTRPRAAFPPILCVSCIRASPRATCPSRPGVS